MENTSIGLSRYSELHASVVVEARILQSFNEDLMQQRKVIVRKLNGEIIKGYLETIPQLRDTKEVSIVSLTEELITVPKQEIKALFFVRKFSGDKEYSEVKFFQNQPRIDGLWVRLTFIDGETVEGIVSNSSRFLLEGGFCVIPGDPKSNNRLIYVPKAALRDFRILGMQYSRQGVLEYLPNSQQPKGTEPPSSIEVVSRR